MPAASNRHIGLGRAQSFLVALGRPVRTRIDFMLMAVASAFGVVRELPRYSSWRRPVRAEFARALRQAIGGGLATVVIAAVLIGIAMVYQALFWLGEAGEERLTGSILVTVLVREVAPVLVGLILLGRSGVACAAEIAGLRAGRQVERLAALGVDPFLLLVLPRATALAVASYTLGMIFVITAMATGLGVGNIAGGVLMSAWEFSVTVLGAMERADFVVFIAKMLLIGLLIGVTAVLTGLDASDRAAANLLSRTFARGMVAILTTSVGLSLTV